MSGRCAHTQKAHGQGEGCATVPSLLCVYIQGERAGRGEQRRRSRRGSHQENDKAVMTAYGFDWRSMTESDCVAALMKMYTELVRKQ